MGTDHLRASASSRWHYWKTPVLFGVGFCVLQILVALVRFGSMDSWNPEELLFAIPALFSGLVLFFLGGVLVGLLAQRLLRGVVGAWRSVLLIALGVATPLAVLFSLVGALLHGPEQIADLPVPVAESPGAVRIGHPERSHLVEYLAPNSVFNSLPRQRSSPHLRTDDRLVTIDRVLHHASLGVA